MNRSWSLKWNTWWIPLGNSVSPWAPGAVSLRSPLPYLLSCVIRSSYCSRSGKIQQEVIIFNVSESFLLKAITVFPNRSAVGQAQVCCIPLSHSLLRTEGCSLKVFGSASTPFSSHPIFMPEKAPFPDLLSTPSKVFFQKSWVLFFLTLSIPVAFSSSWGMFLIQFWSIGTDWASPKS